MGPSNLLGAVISIRKDAPSAPSKYRRAINLPTLATSLGCTAEPQNPGKPCAGARLGFGYPYAISRDDVAAKTGATRMNPLDPFWPSQRTGATSRIAVPAVREATQKEGTKMANQESKKCAHIPCLCDVADGQQYCGEACRAAGSEEVEIACQCSHPACPLTFWQSAPRSAADLAS